MFKALEIYRELYPPSHIWLWRVLHWCAISPKDHDITNSDGANCTVLQKLRSLDLTVKNGDFNFSRGESLLSDSVALPKSFSLVRASVVERSWRDGGYKKPVRRESVNTVNKDKLFIQQRQLSNV